MNRKADTVMTHITNIRFTQEEADMIRQCAANHGMGVSDTIRSILAAHIAEKEEQKSERK